MSSDQYREKVENLLYRFGEKELKPSDQYIDEGKQLAQKVFNVLQQKSRFSVGEVRFAGSIGKKTDVLQPDLDLVVVLIDREPPFESALKDFEDVLTLYEDHLKIRKGSFKSTRFSIQFEFTNGIEVDLLPAANMEPKEVYQLLLKTPNDKIKMRYYGSSLVAKSVAFVTSHPSSFAHVVIRLAKFWFKSLSFGCLVSGGSTIMEIIGIAAAEKVEANYGKPCVLRAMDEVLKMVCQLNTLKLAFKEVGSNKWERVSEGQLESGSGQGLIPGVVATPEILKRKYFIMEPSNPFNDLLEDKEKLIGKFMQFAQVSKERLSNLVAGHYTTFDAYKNVLTIDILKLFEPQPGNLKAEFPSGVPDDLFLACARPYSSLYCDMKVRNEEPLKRKEVKMVLDILKRNLRTVVAATVGSSFGVGNSWGIRNNDAAAATNRITTTDVANAVENMIKKNLATDLGTAPRDREEEMDVTLAVPYDIDGKRYAVKLSMSWNKK